LNSKINNDTNSNLKGRNVKPTTMMLWSLNEHMLIAEWVIKHMKCATVNLYRMNFVLKSQNNRSLYSILCKYSFIITKITAFGKNHVIHGNCRKSPLLWLPWFRDFLLSLCMSDAITNKIYLARISIVCSCSRPTRQACTVMQL